jgi:hypothetical protein
VYFSNETGYTGNYNLRRTQKYGQANLSNSTGKYKLHWEKDSSSVDQSTIENHINSDYKISGVIGDFVFSDNTFLDFSKYPSNGLKTYSQLEPSPDVIFATRNGNL